jgi:hypothetical protein
MQLNNRDTVKISKIFNAYQFFHGIDTDTRCPFAWNDSEMLGEAIRRKKGVINKVDQDLDSFFKVVHSFLLLFQLKLEYNFIRAIKKYNFIQLLKKTVLRRPQPLEKQVTLQQTTLSR